MVDFVGGYLVFDFFNMVVDMGKMCVEDKFVDWLVVCVWVGKVGLLVLDDLVWLLCYLW